jgi:hypothetical protein
MTKRVRPSQLGKQWERNAGQACEALLLPGQQSWL